MTIEAAAQPSGFTASFTIKVTGLRTATVGDKTNVVKQVDWIMIGEESGQRFELPQTTQLPDPNGQLFIPLTALTEAEVIEWVEVHDGRISNIKAHIQYVLDKEVAKATLTTESMPWAPVVETPVAPVDVVPPVV
jgi:hypothetical protein